MSETLSYGIKTFGCKVNAYDSGLLQKRLSKAGYVNQQKQPQVHILNTCAVTAEATREAIKTIRKLKRKEPESFVVVTGCAAQVDTEKFEELIGADLVIANSHKGQLEELILQKMMGTAKDKVYKSNIFKKIDLEAGGGTEQSHTRTFLKIQDGCNSFCTYCVIPFARGKSRSLVIDDLVDRVNEFYASGVREVVLTGVHIGDYEDESRPTGNRGLEALVEEVLVRTPMPRFRLTSLEPLEVTPRLLELYSDERLCAHFHMSIQSAQTEILTRMKRNYSAKDVEHSLKEIALKVKNPFVGMDVIVGFPGESEEQFSETYERLASLPWTKIHVFPYSSRPGTFAARLPEHTKPHEITSRSDRLRALSSDRYACEAMKQIGGVKKVLVLNKPSKGAQGISRDYWPVAFDASRTTPGQEVDVTVTGYDHSHQSRMEGCLVGTPCE